MSWQHIVKCLCCLAGAMLACVYHVLGTAVNGCAATVISHQCQLASPIPATTLELHVRGTSQ